MCSPIGQNTLEGKNPKIRSDGVASVSTKGERHEKEGRASLR